MLVFCMSVTLDALLVCSGQGYASEVEDIMTFIRGKVGCCGQATMVRYRYASLLGQLQSCPPLGMTGYRW